MLLPFKSKQFEQSKKNCSYPKLWYSKNVSTQRNASKKCRWNGKQCRQTVPRSVWATSGEFGTYRLCEQRRFRGVCASAQSRQNLRCSLIQAVSQEEPSDRKPDPWPLWMAGHAQLKFVMTECSKTQIRLTRHSIRITMVFLTCKIWGG